VSAASYDSMTGKWCIEKDLKGSDCSLIEVLCCHFPERLRKTTKTVNYNSCFTGRNFNLAGTVLGVTINYPYIGIFSLLLSVKPI
jgi:hypothetical protein